MMKKFVANSLLFNFFMFSESIFIGRLIWIKKQSQLLLLLPVFIFGSSHLAVLDISINQGNIGVVLHMG